jgi:hypothetical protein
MPGSTVKVSWPSIFGNPWCVEDILAADMETGWQTPLEEAQHAAVESYRAWLEGDDFDGMPPARLADRSALLQALPSLRGKNLACWCRRPAMPRRRAAEAGQYLTLKRPSEIYIEQDSA